MRAEYFPQSCFFSSHEAQIMAHIKENTSFIHTQTRHHSRLSGGSLRQAAASGISDIPFRVLFAAFTHVSGFEQ